MLDLACRVTGSPWDVKASSVVRRCRLMWCFERGVQGIHDTIHSILRRKLWVLVLKDYG
jgi:hypothetical protein